MTHIHDAAPETTLSRRSVARGFAWTVPAVAVTAAAPAFAASMPCTLQTVSTFSTATPTAAITTNKGTGSDGVTVTATATKSGTFNTAVQYNMTSPDGKFIQLAQNPGSGQYQELTFTFSQPVYNLSFVVADVDYLNNMNGTYKDGVVVQQVNGATPVYTTTAKGSNVTGSGTTSSPFQPVSTTTQYVYSDAAGQVTVKVNPTTGVTTFSIRYSDLANRTDSLSQQIYIGGITYTTTNCVLS